MSETEFETRVRGLVTRGKVVGPDDAGQLLSMVAQERERATHAAAEVERLRLLEMERQGATAAIAGAGMPAADGLIPTVNGLISRLRVAERERDEARDRLAAAGRASGDAYASGQREGRLAGLEEAAQVVDCRCTPPSGAKPDWHSMCCTVGHARRIRALAVQPAPVIITSMEDFDAHATERGYSSRYCKECEHVHGAPPRCGHHLGGPEGVCDCDAAPSGSEWERTERRLKAERGGYLCPDCKDQGCDPSDPGHCGGLEVQRALEAEPAQVLPVARVREVADECLAEMSSSVAARHYDRKLRQRLGLYRKEQPLGLSDAEGGEGRCEPGCTAFDGCHCNNCGEDVAPVRSYSTGHYCDRCAPSNVRAPEREARGLPDPTYGWEAAPCPVCGAMPGEPHKMSCRPSNRRDAERQGHS